MPVWHAYEMDFPILDVDFGFTRGGLEIMIHQPVRDVDNILVRASP
jgi:hypothetical protein